MTPPPPPPPPVEFNDFLPGTPKGPTPASAVPSPVAPGRGPSIGQVIGAYLDTAQRLASPRHVAALIWVIAERHHRMVGEPIPAHIALACAPSRADRFLDGGDGEALEETLRAAWCPTSDGAGDGSSEGSSDGPGVFLPSWPSDVPWAEADLFDKRVTNGLALFIDSLRERESAWVENLPGLQSIAVFACARSTGADTDPWGSADHELAIRAMRPEGP